MSELTRRLRSARAPGEDEAFRRAHTLAMAAVGAAPARHRHRRAARMLAPFAAALLVAALLLSPAGADVR
jgi:hypothetical protein